MHWLADSRAGATRITFEEGEFVWVKGLPNPRGGTERHHLMARVHNKVTVDVSSTKYCQNGGKTMTVVPLYCQDPVTVKASQCLRLSSSKVPAPLTHVYKPSDCIPLPLGLALFPALPKYLQDSSLLPSRLDQEKGRSKGKGNHTSISIGCTTALSEASGVRRVIHKLDRKGEGGAKVSLFVGSPSSTNSGMSSFR